MSHVTCVTHRDTSVGNLRLGAAQFLESKCLVRRCWSPGLARHLTGQVSDTVEGGASTSAHRVRQSGSSSVTSVPCTSPVPSPHLMFFLLYFIQR